MKLLLSSVQSARISAGDPLQVAAARYLYEGKHSRMTGTSTMVRWGSLRITHTDDEGDEGDADELINVGSKYLYGLASCAASCPRIRNAVENRKRPRQYCRR
jgi:hypothetical protein